MGLRSGLYFTILNSFERKAKGGRGVEMVLTGNDRYGTAPGL